MSRKPRWPTGEPYLSLRKAVVTPLGLTAAIWMPNGDAIAYLDTDVCIWPRADWSVVELLKFARDLVPPRLGGEMLYERVEQRHLQPLFDYGDLSAVDVMRILRLAANAPCR